MSYICKNPECSAPDNKKGKPYPSAMECPFCDTPLVEVIFISEEEKSLISCLPYVIAYPLKRSLVEKNPLRKLNLLRDTFLNYLKYLGLITASEFFNSPIKDKSMVALFNRTLTETSFGLWNEYIRETLKFLENRQHVFFCQELNEYYKVVQTGSNRNLYKGEVYVEDAFGETKITPQKLTGIDSLINFRNRYLGHQQTLDDSTYMSLWDQYFPIFRKLLVQMRFCADYPMYKTEHGETYRLQSDELVITEAALRSNANVWLQDQKGNRLDILPFFIVPGELSIKKEDKEQVLIYESYTGKTIKFFSPEGTEKQTSGKILERLNLLLRNKQQEQPYTPETFTKDVFLSRIADENKLFLDTLVAEKKVIPGVYVHRQGMEIKLREWVGARASIFFMAAEAGSGKTNLLIEMQKQYAEWGLNSLLIRAGRMEKPQLSEQIAYMLNIDISMGLKAYPTIAGTQAAPTFILVDGLNEAFNAERLWMEVLELSQLFEPGCLKFVVTSRANSAADLERYSLTNTDLNLVYGEKKVQQEGLADLTFWLTALNMEEMKAAWGNYANKDMSRYKPLFSFEDIAIFDRAIYDQINNPLVLRIFLEVYNRKNLPKKGNQHLNVWQDWLKTFTADEQTFLGLLATEIWNKGGNELLLDDLLKIETLKSYLISDNLNSPYQRLKNLGWVSRYVKDLNVCIGFTVEGLLLYLFGIELQQQKTAIDISFFDEVLQKNNRLQKAGLESFLSEVALKGDLRLISELIDIGGDKLEICVRPLLYFMRSYRVKVTLDKLLANPTDNDWKVLLMLNELMNLFQFEKLQVDFSDSLIKYVTQNGLQINISLLISILPKANAAFKNDFVSKIDYRNLNNEELEELAFYFTFNGFSEKAVNIYEALFDYKGISNPIKLNKIASAYSLKGEVEQAKSLYLKALDYALKDTKHNNSILAMLYYNIARVYDNNPHVSIEYLQKALKIELDLYGEIHKDIVDTYILLAKLYDKLDDQKSESESIQKIIKIHEKGIDNYSTNTVLAGYYYYKEDYVKALNYYKNAYQIQSKRYGNNNYETLESILNLSYCNRQLENHEEQLANLEMAKNILDKNEIFNSERFLTLSNLANLYDYYGNYTNAISLFDDLFHLIENNKIEGIYDTMDYYAAIFFYAQTLYNNNQYRDSLKLIEGLPENFRNKKNILTLCANNYYCIEEYRQAIESYNKVQVLITDSVEKISIYEYLAACYQSINIYEEAIGIYSTIIDLATKENLLEDLNTAYFRLGYCYGQLNLNSKAIEIFKIGFKISNRTYFLKYIAQIYEKEKDKNLAFENYLEYVNRIKSEGKYDTEEGIEKAINHIFLLANELNKMSSLPVWMK